MIVRAFTLAILVSLVLSAPIAAQHVFTFPGGTANDVTPDGSVVVGYYPGGSFVWHWKQNPSPTLVPGGTMVAVSDDGTVAAGNINDPITNKQVAAIWTQAAGWQSIGAPFGAGCDSFLSSAFDISGDGTTVVGMAWMGCTPRAFRWTAITGMVLLQQLGIGSEVCNAISGDGSTLGGYSTGPSGRTPAYWASNLTGAVINPSFQGEVYGFTEDGELSVGALAQGGPMFEAFLRNKQTGVITNLGHLNSGWAGRAVDISEGGKVIVGYDTDLLASEAWVWMQGDGLKSLNARLSAMGVTGAPLMLDCRAVSDDGEIIVGRAQFGMGTGAYVVNLNGLAPYGIGVPGCTGNETLSASPSPHVGESTFTLHCTNAPPSSLGLWLITDAQDLAGSDPFGIGATLHVNLFAATVIFTPNGTSDASGLGTAPVPIPNNPTIAGANLYAQVLWAWPAGSCTTNYPLPFGLSTSNGLVITILP